MPQSACRDDGFRISGLQLPDDVATEERTATRSLSVCQTTTYRWSLADDLSRYEGAGIGAVGLYRPKLEEWDEEAAIDLIRSSGLSVSSLSWIGGFTGCDGSRQADSIFDANEAVQFAAAVAANTVAVVGGNVGRHIANHARRLLVSSLKDVCGFAEDLDVRLSLHPLSMSRPRGHAVLKDVDDALDLIAAVGCTNLGLVLDIAELTREGGLSGRLDEVVPHVHVVRISDRRGRTGGTRSGGECQASVTEAVNRVFDAGFEGPFEFDFWSEEERSADDYHALLVSIRSRFEAFGLEFSAGQ